MTHINLTKCDGPSCEKQVDTSEWHSPTYHKIILGGSDFEMTCASFLGEREFDFCSIECMQEFLSELKEEQDG